MCELCNICAYEDIKRAILQCLARQDMRNRMFELIYLPSKSDILGGNAGDISSSWTGGTEPRATERKITKSIVWAVYVS